MSTIAIAPENVEVTKGVKLPIYMDNHATTRTDPRVLEEMLPYFTEYFGNAASRNHEFGWVAEQAVEQARERIAKLIGANTKEIIFTSGATESDNLAIKGVAEMYREKGNHIITQAIEHKAVLDTCKRLEKYGFRVTYLPVQKDGRIDLDDLKRAMDDKTILVSIMAANNEIGVLQPIREIGALCHERGVLFHTDAVQAIGKVPFNVVQDNVDLASITAHKLYGPKGVGALYVRRKNPRVQLVAQIDGGGHERGMRSGTLNVPGIVGLGKACAIAHEGMAEEAKKMSGLRDRLKDKIMGQLDEVYINGSTGASPAQQPEHQLRLRGRRVAADGYQRYCGFERLGMHLRHAGAILCIEGLGCWRRSGTQLHTLRPGALQYRSRGGLRRRARGRDGKAAARVVAAVRDGERRHRFDQGAVGG